MSLCYLKSGDLKSTCENYHFTTDDLKEYSRMEIKMMNFYLERKRSEGDSRDKNMIYIEWIKVYSEFFRIMYLILMKGVA